MQEKDACQHSHTHTCTHSYISQEIDWEPKVRCENVVVVNIAWFSEGWFRHQFQKNSPYLWFRLPLVPVANRQNITHARTQTHENTRTHERPITFRSYSSPVCPLCCSTTLLLMIFLILRKETKVRCCTLISSLWTSSGCGCYCLPLCSLKLAQTHTHANMESLTHTYYYCLGQTCWPRHQLLWIGLTKSGADPLSKAWENP